MLTWSHYAFRQRLKNTVRRGPPTICFSLTRKNLKSTSEAVNILKVNEEAFKRKVHLSFNSDEPWLGCRLLRVFDFCMLVCVTDHRMLRRLHVQDVWEMWQSSCRICDLVGNDVVLSSKHLGVKRCSIAPNKAVAKSQVGTPRLLEIYC